MSLKRIKNVGTAVLVTLPLWGSVTAISAMGYLENRNVVNRAYIDGESITEYSDGRGIMVSRPANLSAISERVFDRDHDGVADDGYRAICAFRIGCSVKSLTRGELDKIYEPAFNSLRGR